MSYGRSVQVVITIQNTTLSPEELQKGIEDRLHGRRHAFPLMVAGDTISAYHVDCECKHCKADKDDEARANEYDDPFAPDDPPGAFQGYV
jgi:hypothetical protein